MRKIEQQMAAAVAARRNFKSGNTKVTNEVTEGGIVLGPNVYLHGHHIARITIWGEIIPNRETFARYPTRTTASRLRALGIKASLKNGLPHIDGKPI